MPYPFAFCYTDCTRQSANSKGLTASRCLHTLSLWHAMRTHHRRVMLSAAKHPGQPGEAMLTPMGLPCVMRSGSKASGQPLFSTASVDASLPLRMTREGDFFTA